MRKSSRFMEERVNSRPAYLRFPYIMPVIGGVPIIHEGECVGGIGVAGVQSEEDEQVAQAGVNALSRA